MMVLIEVLIGILYRPSLKSYSFAQTSGLPKSRNSRDLTTKKTTPRVLIAF